VATSVEEADHSLSQEVSCQITGNCEWGEGNCATINGCDVSFTCVPWALVIGLVVGVCLIAAIAVVGFVVWRKKKANSY
jgi:hypothetical protein